MCIFEKQIQFGLVAVLLLSSFTSKGSNCPKPKNNSQIDTLSEDYIGKNCEEYSFDENAEQEVCDCVVENEERLGFKTELYQNIKDQVEKGHGDELIREKLRKDQLFQIQTRNKLFELSQYDVGSMKECSLSFQVKSIVNDCKAKGENTLVHKFESDLLDFLEKDRHDFENEHKSFAQSNQGLVDTTARPKPACEISGAFTRKINSQREQSDFVTLINDLDLSALSKVEEGKEIKDFGIFLSMNTSIPFGEENVYIESAKKHSLYSHILSDRTLLKDVIEKIQKAEPKDKGQVLNSFIKEKVLPKVVDQSKKQCSSFYSNLRELMCRDASLPVIVDDPSSLGQSIANPDNKLLHDEVINGQKANYRSNATFGAMCTKKKEINQKILDNPLLSKNLVDNKDFYINLDDYDSLFLLPPKIRTDAQEMKVTPLSMLTDSYVKTQEEVRNNICMYIPPKGNVTKSLEKLNCENQSSDTCKDLLSFISLTGSDDHESIDKKIEKIRNEKGESGVKEFLKSLYQSVKPTENSLMNEYYNFAPPTSQGSNSPQSGQDNNQGNGNGTQSSTNNSSGGATNNSDSQNSNSNGGQNSSGNQQAFNNSGSGQPNYQGSNQPTYQPTTPITQEGHNQYYQSFLDANKELKKYVNKYDQLLSDSIREGAKTRDEITRLARSTELLRDDVRQRDGRIDDLEEKLDEIQNQQNSPITSQIVKEVLPTSGDDNEEVIIPLKANKDKENIKTVGEEKNGKASKLNSISTVPFNLREKDLLSDGKMLEVKNEDKGTDVVRMTGAMAKDIDKFDFDKLYQDKNDKNHKDLMTLSKILVEEKEFVLKLLDFEFKIKPNDGNYEIVTDEKTMKNPLYKKAYLKLRKAVDDGKFNTIKGFYVAPVRLKDLNDVLDNTKRGKK